MSEEMKTCKYCKTEVPKKVIKCKHCGSTIGATSAQKFALGCTIFLGIVVLIAVFSSMNYDGGDKYSSYTTLNDAYNDHKNFIWNACKEGVKILDSTAGKFDGPTYAGEYLGEFIIKGRSDSGNFKCLFEKSNNERGMNLKDVARER